MTIQTILVDDEPRGLNSLKMLIEEYCPQLNIVAECRDAAEAETKIKSLKPHLVFLDISLPDRNSLDLLSSFDTLDFEVIFVTAHADYALQAFHYSAVDYLMKPVDEELLTEAVKRAESRIHSSSLAHNISALVHNLRNNGNTQEMKLCITSLKGFQVVDLREILYCEASGNYTNFYFTSGSSICTAKTIQEYETLLADSGFIRLHKSSLVNLLHVKEYLKGEGGSVILSNKKELEVSRRRKLEFLKKMRSFYKM